MNEDPKIYLLEQSLKTFLKYITNLSYFNHLE